MKTNSVILEKSKSGQYSAYLPELPGCIATGKTIQETKNSIVSAVEFHLEGMVEDGDEIPEFFAGEYKLTFELDIQTLFEWFSGLMTKKAVSKLTGMNQSLVSQYANGEKVPGPKQRRRIEQALHKFGEDLCSVSL